MAEIDYSVESEDEWYEDFSHSTLSDKEVQEFLIIARKNSDIQLRRLVKEVQFLRNLAPHLIEVAEKGDDKNNILDFLRRMIKAIDLANNKNKSL